MVHFLFSTPDSTPKAFASASRTTDAIERFCS